MPRFKSSSAEEGGLPRCEGKLPKGVFKIRLGRAVSLGLAVALTLGGCVSFPADRIGVCARAPVVTDDGSVQSTTLSVLTYNVEGLPWPARANRGPRLREIARQFAAMKAAGTAPDVVMLQEAFTGDAARIGSRAQYANYARGPGAGARRGPTSEDADPELVKNRKRLKGEGIGPVLSSGLYVLSDYPIVQVNQKPFRRRECAGFDCLANKGVQHVRIAVPGVPDPVEIINMHLNSEGLSGVSESRSGAAHRLQLDAVRRFISQTRDEGLPMILGGDLNAGRSPQRFEWLEDRLPWPLVHRWCITHPCDVRLSWDGDEPWMDTQDLLAFASGGRVQVQPLRVEAMFDAPWRGKPLADHDGFLTTFRLSWKREHGGDPSATAYPLRCLQERAPE